MNMDDIDGAVLGQFLNDIGPGGGEFVQLFVDETRARIARMTDTAGRGAATDVENDAHSLKSAAATFGLTVLAETARELESACNDGDGELAQELLGAIEDGVETAIKALREHALRLC